MALHLVQQFCQFDRPVATPDPRRHRQKYLGRHEVSQRRGTSDQACDPQVPRIHVSFQLCRQQLTCVSWY